MHLLEADASTNSPRSCMESPTTEYQAKSNNVSMIQTSSRLETNLPSRIGDPTISGIHCSSSRLFTEASLKPNEKILQRSHCNKTDHTARRTPITQKERSNHPTFKGKDDNRKCKKTSSKEQNLVTNDHSSSHTSDSRRKVADLKQVKERRREKHRNNGIINGIITSENQRHNGKETSKISDEELRDSRQNFSNKNNNNCNRPRGLTPPHKISDKFNTNTMNMSTRLGSTNHNYIENRDSVDQYNGSNILKRMYESFGKAVHTDNRFTNSHPTKLFENQSFNSQFHKEKIPYAPTTSPPSRKRKQELLAKHENENAVKPKAKKCQEEIHPPSPKLQPLHPTPIRLNGFNHSGLQSSPDSRYQRSSQERFSNRSASPTEDERCQVTCEVRDNTSQYPTSSYKRNHNIIRKVNEDQHGELLTTPKRKQASAQKSKIAKLDGGEDLQMSAALKEYAIDRIPSTPGKNDRSKNKLKSPSHSIESLLASGQDHSMHRKRSSSETTNSIEKQPPFVRNISDSINASHSRRSPIYEVDEPRRSRSPDRTTELATKSAEARAQYEGRNSRESPHSDANPNQRHQRISSNGQDLLHPDRFSADNKDFRDTLLSDKEFIEKSLRQNDHHVFPGQLPGPFPNQCMFDPNTLALLQANLLSSMQSPNMLSDPAMMLPTPATPYATGYPTNPLLQYLANPYLLRGLMPGAQYNQALTQQLIAQQRTMLLHSLQGPQAMHPALNPLFYGGIPLPETNPITAALAAASIRANPTAVPPCSPSAFSYPFAKTESEREPVDRHLQEREEETKSTSVSVLDSHPGLVDNRPLPAQLPSTVHLYRNNHSDPKKKIIHPPKVNDKRCYSTEDSPFKKTPDERKKLPKEPLYPAALASTADAAFQLERSSTSHKFKKKSLKSVDRQSFQKDSFSRERGELKTDKDLIETSSDGATAKNNSAKDTDESIPEEGEKPESSSSSSRPSSYKNLTRERRLVANARERTRVHTISSAFEELRQQIPSYSCNQKLSKLAILRIACSYIQSLSVLAGRDNENTFQDSVDQCTRVLQAESRARSRRKSNKAQIDWEVANYERIPSISEEPRSRSTNTERSFDSEPSSTYVRPQDSDRIIGKHSPTERNEIPPKDRHCSEEDLDYSRDDTNRRHSQPVDYHYTESTENQEITTDNGDSDVEEEIRNGGTREAGNEGEDNGSECENRGNFENNRILNSAEAMNDLINVED